MTEPNQRDPNRHRNSSEDSSPVPLRDREAVEVPRQAEIRPGDEDGLPDNPTQHRVPS